MNRKLIKSLEWLISREMGLDNYSLIPRLEAAIEYLQSRELRGFNGYVERSEFVGPQFS